MAEVDKSKPMTKLVCHRVESHSFDVNTLYCVPLVNDRLTPYPMCCGQLMKIVPYAPPPERESER